MSSLSRRARRAALLHGTLAVALLVTTACRNGDAPEARRTGAPGPEPAAAPTNRIDIPPAVRANLGITFVKVEPRRIEQTLRVPGRFELEPTARREYRTMLPGQVELLVEQFDRVETGTPLYRIDSLAWRDMQQSLTEAESAIRRLTTKLDSFATLRAAHERHEESLRESVRVWTERVTQLEALRDAGGGRASEIAEARSMLASFGAELANVQEKEVELEASQLETAAELDAAKARRRYLLDAAAAILDLPVKALTEPVMEEGGERLQGDEHSERPRWSTIDRVEVRAAEPGVVEQIHLTSGGWADERSTVMSVVRPDRLRFHASGLQSDLGVLRDGLEARIVPPTPTSTGRAVPLHESMSGTLRVGLAGDAADRTIDLYVAPEQLAAWARPGVAAQLEIVTDSTATPQLAIPLAAVQRDGLTPVIFRRAPDNPDKAIRMEADLGENDGRWVALLSGVREGDEVVLDGAFQLMLATSGSMSKGGHFHPDGTFHEGDH